MSVSTDLGFQLVNLFFDGPKDLGALNLVLDSETKLATLLTLLL